MKPRDFTRLAQEELPRKHEIIENTKLLLDFFVPFVDFRVFVVIESFDRRSK